MSILENIQQLCKEHNNMSVPKLEKELNFSRGAMYKWDTSSPSIDKLQKVADYFDVSVDYLTGKTNIRTTITTIAAHRADNAMDDLPPEAIKSVEEFIELMRIKYQKKPTGN